MTKQVASLRSIKEAGSSEILSSSFSCLYSFDFYHLAWYVYELLCYDFIAENFFLCRILYSFCYYQVGFCCNSVALCLLLLSFLFLKIFRALLSEYFIFFLSYWCVFVFSVFHVHIFTLFFILKDQIKSCLHSLDSQSLIFEEILIGM